MSYFSQSDTMPLSAIRNIGDENIKEAVKQNFDKAAQQGLIELDGDNIRITAKGKDYISQPDFIKAAQAMYRVQLSLQRKRLLQKLQRLFRRLLRKRGK